MLGKATFFHSVSLHPDPVHGRRAITNLSSSRSEALSRVATYLTIYSEHTGHPGNYRFLLWKSELKARISTARGAGMTN